MPLVPGTKLGPYEIAAPLGAGGMGEVYRALDTRLDRQVAVKILAGHLSASPEQKQRLEREARAISALNHPSICQLYDIGSQDGTDFLVMEFLEGETLADRLRRGALPLAEILKIGIAVADALAAAHRHGIIHRDLKPGNIMLTKAGAKLMDFGLAKPLGLAAASPAAASAPSFSAAPTLSGPSPLSPLTAAGSIVGTVQYMSPEQVEGREADARSDIFALGSVLYEMAAGSRPFQGKSQLSIASAILEHDPQPLGAAKPDTPPAFEHIVSVCLAKNPDERFQTAGDVRLELQWIASGKSPAAGAHAPDAAPASFRRERLLWAAALLLAIAGAALGNFLLRPAHPARLIRTSINPPEKTSFILVGDSAGPPVISPDGSTVAFTAAGADSNSSIWVRPMNSTEAHELPGTGGATFPFWSPDSHSLGFFASGKIKTVDLSGGAPQTVCDAPFGRGGAWGADGVIVFSGDASAPLARVAATGGAPALMTAIDFSRHSSHRWPFFLPDGRHLLYLAMNHDSSKSANDTIYYASADGRENRPLLHAESNAIYAGGFLLYARGDQLMAQPFDPSSGAIRGDAHVVAQGVMDDFTTWHMDASASSDGLLVFASGGNSDVQLVAIAPGGKQIAVVADKMTNLSSAVVSPQGDRIALDIAAGAADVWVLDLARGVRTRLTFGPVSNVNPVWSPDGKWIAFSAARGPDADIVRKRSDGTGAEEILATEGRQALPSDWSRDGKYIFYYHLGREEEGVWALPLEGERKPRRVIERGQNAVLSPDGHWLAYESSESGTLEVYVTGFDGAQGKWQVSLHGGFGAQWSRDGRQLYYFDPSRNVLAVSIQSVAGALQFGTPRVVASNSMSAPFYFYSVSPDGKRIYLPNAPQQVSQSVTVVSNFTAALR
ncbi:MAG TPA: protein kinase [Candidatus Acidoferrales bacterium]|nr:protein kinase [Candidatus Acidoferrales bacterium]